MIATETAKTAVLVLLGLAVLWIVIVILKNDTETIVRALLVAAVLGLALYYLNQTKLDELTFGAIRDDLFPVKTRDYVYERTEGRSGGFPSTTYVFQDPGPPLPLVMAEGGRYMAVRDVRPLNAVLARIGLPPVSEGVPELASVTGSSLDSEKFRWDDYEKGVLIVIRGICRDMASAQSFPCIARIILQSR